MVGDAAHSVPHEGKSNFYTTDLLSVKKQMYKRR